jgi:cytoskeletal protein CcmA (bactofilin family)
MISIPGEITGDAHVAASVLTIGGHVGEAVRAMGSQMIVTGTIDGDLLYLGSTLEIAPGARIGGDLWVLGAKATIAGDVAGDLRVKGGRLVLSGRVGRSADVEVDGFTVDPSARIGGDLRYEARRSPATPLESVVAGKVERVEPEEEKEEARWGPSVGSVVLWLLKLLGAAVVGLVALRLWPARSARSAAAIGREPVMSLGIGLGAGLVLPLAAAIAAGITLLVGAPLAIIVCLAVLVGFYLGKLPVALWIGERLLRRKTATGRPRAAALLIGIVILYVVFTVPYLGAFLWFVASFVGLGAIVLASWRQSPPEGPQPGGVQVAAS